jgi:hypothetical protein
VLRPPIVRRHETPPEQVSTDVLNVRKLLLIFAIHTRATNIARRIICPVRRSGTHKTSNTVEVLSFPTIRFVHPSSVHLQLLISNKIYLYQSYNKQHMKADLELIPISAGLKFRTGTDNNYQCRLKIKNRH